MSVVGILTKSHSLVPVIRYCWSDCISDQINEFRIQPDTTLHLHICLKVQITTKRCKKKPHIVYYYNYMYAHVFDWNYLIKNAVNISLWKNLCCTKFTENTCKFQTAHFLSKMSIFPHIGYLSKIECLHPTLRSSLAIIVLHICLTAVIKPRRWQKDIFDNRFDLIWISFCVHRHTLMFTPV